MKTEEATDADISDMDMKTTIAAISTITREVMAMGHPSVDVTAIMVLIATTMTEEDMAKINLVATRDSTVEGIQATAMKGTPVIMIGALLPAIMKEIT
jgi:hypothetical protein